MKPAIIFHPDEPHRAHLIDKDAVFPLPLRGSGERRLHYATAVSIQDLDAGQFRMNLLSNGDLIGDKYTPAPDIIAMHFDGITTPFPAVYASLTPHDHVVVPPGHRNIDLRAAMVLLKLAESFNNLRIEVSRPWGFRPPAIEGAEIPWSDWRFITAWLWSGWHRRTKKPTLAERFAEVEALGYDRGLKSFEAMHRQMFPKNSR